jgi:hypothetical protein
MDNVRIKAGLRATESISYNDCTRQLRCTIFCQIRVQVTWRNIGAYLLVRGHSLHNDRMQTIVNLPDEAHWLLVVSLAGISYWPAATMLIKQSLVHPTTIESQSIP